MCHCESAVGRTKQSGGPDIIVWHPGAILGRQAAGALSLLRRSSRFGCEGCQRRYRARECLPHPRLLRCARNDVHEFYAQSV